MTSDLKAMREDLDRYRDALAERKAQLAEEVREAVERFQKDTGLVPRRLDVEVLDVSTLSEPDGPGSEMVGIVTVDVDAGRI